MTVIKLRIHSSHIWMECNTNISEKIARTWTAAQRLVLESSNFLGAPGSFRHTKMASRVRRLSSASNEGRRSWWYRDSQIRKCDRDHYFDIHIAIALWDVMWPSVCNSSMRYEIDGDIVRRQFHTSIVSL